jgi:hypothetical protein
MTFIPQVKMGLFNVCSEGRRTVTCEGQEQFYCASWGCETSVTGNGRWKVSKEDLMTVAQQGHSSNVLLKFTNRGRQAKRWEARKSWGLQLYIIQGSNPRLLFKVRLLIKLIVNPLPAARFWQALNLDEEALHGTNLLQGQCSDS